MIEGIKKKKKDIAIFMAKFSCGGAEKVMLNLADHFIQMGRSVDFVVASTEGPFLKQVPPKAGIIDLKAGRPMKSLFGLIGYLRNIRPTCLLSPIYNVNIIALLAQRSANVPTKVFIREASTLSKISKDETKITLKAARYLMPYLYPWANGIISISEGVAEDLSKTIGIDPQRITLIYNPCIAKKMPGYMTRTIDHDWFKRNNIPIILSVGRLNKAKDYPTLLAAIQIVLKHRDARLIIIGEGEERYRLEKMIADLGLQNNVSLLGYVAEPYAYMAKASVFVLSSVYEGFPNVLVEAMAMGTPVVSTNCKSGPSEILKNGQYGSLVPIRNPEALAQAILSVLSGKAPDVPPSWLEQFTVEYGANRYLSLMGI